MNDLTDLMMTAALAAAEIILDVYQRPIMADHKADGSPVTEADQRAETEILRHLAATGLPVLAEESVAAGHVPTLGESYFVVDPLDGTKEFLKRNGEFTVNIALCRADRPVAGIVLAPALGTAYWGDADGAFEARIVDGGLTQAVPIRVRMEGAPRIVASRSHGHAALADLCRTFNVAEDVSVGSSLKFCLLARGDAQLYPRFTPTCEWDTAAGQAVLEAAGGFVLGLDGEPLTCGHTNNRFLNDYFVAASDLSLARNAAAEMRRLLGRPESLR